MDRSVILAQYPRGSGKIRHVMDDRIAELSDDCIQILSERPHVFLGPRAVLLTREILDDIASDEPKVFHFVNVASRTDVGLLLMKKTFETSIRNVVIIRDPLCSRRVAAFYPDVVVYDLDNFDTSIPIFLFI